MNINTASAAQLEELPGVGPATAQAIIDYRTTNGSFSSVEELTAVDGIGAGKLAKIRGHATV
ncbi:MAG: helix-hairpin-helix domain-containing protein [Lawsonella sp.]|nr:helix-hairpin-helix domain-containing protein [Lawsonella sp.]MDY2978921.1 helix-hairpin-helix domain-containing protein [Lawsonella sp.]